MAKRKKKTNSKQSATQKQISSTKWVLLAIAILAVVVGLVIGAFILRDRVGDDPTATTGSQYQGISPEVDDSDATTMRIVKAGTAYLTKDTAAGTVFSFRRGDKVEVVELDKDWATIAVEGRGYYVPRNMVRGLDEHIIVIDAGHQLREDKGKEAIGPGGAETEQRMDTGNVGVTTGQPEYEVTLNIALKLREELQKRGYTVYMTRSSNDNTSISYKERAQVANNLCADAYLTLHNGYSEDPEVRGLSAVCQTEKSSYIADLYTENKELCNALLTAMVHATGSKRLGLQETDKLSGINWCSTPMAMLELGYLSNENDDRLLTAEPYLEKLVAGIADGLDRYFTEEDDDK